MRKFFLLRSQFVTFLWYRDIMKRINTLKLNYEFKNVFNRGKYYIGNQVIIYILKNKKMKIG